MNTRHLTPLAAIFTALCCLGPLQAAEDAIELLVRADDMGVAQSMDAACIESYRNGIARSVEVIVPGPWFLHAAKLLAENPELDVGVHLCLTSEWENLKWGPLTEAHSLVDADGYFRPMTSQRRDFPLDTGFLQANPDLGEVERELRAQIEMALRHIPRVSHVSAHMGTATATPELRALTARLAIEYGLSLEMDQLKPLRGFTGHDPAAREKSLIGLLENLEPGKWLLIEHPGFDTPEARAIGHLGYYDVAADRAAVTHAFTSAKVREVIERRGIKLISYSDLKKASPVQAK